MAHFFFFFLGALPRSRNKASILAIGWRKNSQKHSKNIEQQQFYIKIWISLVETFGLERTACPGFGFGPTCHKADSMLWVLAALVLCRAQDWHSNYQDWGLGHVLTAPVVLLFESLPSWSAKWAYFAHGCRIPGQVVEVEAATTRRQSLPFGSLAMNWCNEMTWSVFFFVLSVHVFSFPPSGRFKSPF